MQAFLNKKGGCDAEHFNFFFLIKQINPILNLLISKILALYVA